MTRFARIVPVLVIEEPAFEGTEPPHFKSYSVADNLTIFVPHLMQGMPANTAISAQRLLTGKLLREARIETPVLWYYTPMALQFADAITAAVTVYDCMDELSAFQDEPPELRRLETDLLGRTDIVFTGGMSLYEAKRAQHPNVHAFPSAVDAEHFGKARAVLPDPSDQAGIPRPRLGFWGHRRAVRSRADRLAGPVAAGLAADPGRAGCQDRSCRSTASRQHTLPRRQALSRLARLHGKLECGHDAVRT